MELLVVLYSVVEILEFRGRVEEPSSSPCQLIPVVRALVILLTTGYRRMIKAAVSISEFVQVLRVLETLCAIFGIDVPEDDAGGREGGRRLTGEIGTYGCE